MKKFTWSGVTVIDLFNITERNILQINKEIDQVTQMTQDYLNRLEDLKQYVALKYQASNNIFKINLPTWSNSNY